MRLLLDTHAFIWWLTDDPSLSRIAHAAIGDTGRNVFVSAATAWEIATKFRIGKLPNHAVIAEDVRGWVAKMAFFELPVTVAHAQLAGALPGSHKDPFDRMLMAQAMAENLVLVSNERLFDAYGVKRLW